MKLLLKSYKKGFTIVELVIVIAVIAILSAVLIPTFSSIIKSANESKIKQEIKNSLILLSTNYPNIDLEKLIIVYTDNNDEKQKQEYIFTNEKQELELIEYDNYSINDDLLAVNGILYYKINKISDAFPDNILFFTTKDYAELLNPDKPVIKEEKYRLIIDDNSVCINKDEIERVEGEYQENEVIYITFQKGYYFGELIIYLNEKEVNRISSETIYKLKITMPKEDVVIRTELVNNEGLYLSKVEDGSKKYFTEETLNKITGQFKEGDRIIMVLSDEAISQTNINETIQIYVNNELFEEIKGEDLHSNFLKLAPVYVVENEDIIIRIEKKVDDSFIGLGVIYPFINELTSYDKYEVLAFEDMNYNLNKLQIKSCYYVNDYYASIYVDFPLKENRYIDFIKNVKYYKMNSDDYIDSDFSYPKETAPKVYRIIHNSGIYDFLYKDKYEYNGEIYVAEKMYQDLSDEIEPKYYSAFINPTLANGESANDCYTSKVYPFLLNNSNESSSLIQLSKCDYSVQTFDIRSMVLEEGSYSPSHIIYDLNKSYGFSISKDALEYVSIFMNDGEKYSFIYNIPLDSTLKTYTIVNAFKFSDIINVSTKEVNAAYEILSLYDNCDQLKLITQKLSEIISYDMYEYDSVNNQLSLKKLTESDITSQDGVVYIESQCHRLRDTLIEDETSYKIYEKLNEAYEEYIKLSTGKQIDASADNYLFVEPFETLIKDKESINLVFHNLKEGYLHIYLNGFYYETVNITGDLSHITHRLIIDSSFAKDNQIVIDYGYTQDLKEYVNLLIVDDNNIVISKEKIDSLNKIYLKGTSVTINFDQIESGILTVYVNDYVKDVLDITTNNQSYELTLEENTTIRFEYTEIVPVDNTIKLNQIYPWIKNLTYDSVTEVISYFDTKQLIEKCTYIDNTNNQSIEEIENIIEGIKNIKYVYDPDKYKHLLLIVNTEIIIKDESGDINNISIPSYMNVGGKLYILDRNTLPDINSTYNLDTYTFGYISDAKIYRYGIMTDETIDLRTLIFKETIRNDNYDYTTDVSFKVNDNGYHINIIGNKELKIEALEGDIYLEVVSDIELNNYISNSKEVAITVKSGDNLDNLNDIYLNNFSKTIIVNSNSSLSKQELFNLTTLNNYNYLYGYYDDYDYYIGDGKLFYNMLGSEILYDVKDDVEITVKASNSNNSSDNYEVIRSCSVNVLEAGIAPPFQGEPFAISKLPSFMSLNGQSDEVRIINTYEELETIYNEMFTGEYPYYRLELFCDKDFFKDNIMVVYGRKSTILYYNYCNFSYSNPYYVEKKDGSNYSQFLDSQTYSVDFIKVPRRDLLEDKNNDPTISKNLINLKRDSEEYFKTTIKDICVYMAIDGYIIYTFNNKELIDLGELNTLEIYGQKLISTSNIYIYEYGSDEDKIMLLEPNQTFVKGLDEKMDYFKAIHYTYNKYLHD